MRPIQFLMLALLPLLVAGCTRSRYRVAADRDSYEIVHEKSQLLAEQTPSSYTVRPDSRSRFYDPSCPDCPQLPVPRPILNGYQLPQLQSDLGMCGPDSGCLCVTSPDASQTQKVAQTQDAGQDQTPDSNSQTVAEQTMVGSPVVPASFNYTESPVRPAAQLELGRPQDGPSTAAEPLPVPQPIEPPIKSENNSSSETAKPPASNSSNFYRPIPAEAWEVLPQTCLARMLEFESIRTEYARSYVDTHLDSSSPQDRRLTLANLMELATINSREYQVAKETLYRSALALTAQRYQYDLNPVAFGNGTAANYTSTRINGATTNRLGIPTGVGVQKSLASAGQFVASFANSVVLTFNGPSGFAADVGSDLVFDFQQTIFQRDVRFESLTRAERDVVYATRDYLRFRKQLFRDLAGAYYNLLVTYRSIEISSQDYFTNLRGFLQSQSEYRTAEKISRVQVDQFEQNVLRTRGNVIANCFALEAALDQLKFRLGLPTEMPILLDLAELQSIALRDELSVARQMIQRARGELLIAKSSNVMDATTLANVAEVLADRMSNILRIQQRIEQSNSLQTADPQEPSTANANAQALATATEQLEQLRRRLQILGIRMEVEMLRGELETQMKSETAAPPLLVINRVIEFCEAEEQVIAMALQDSQLTSESLESQSQKLSMQLQELQEFLVEIASQLRASADVTQATIFAEIPERSRQAVRLMEAFEQLSNQVTQSILPQGEQTIPDRVEETVNQTIDLSDRLLDTGPDGWQEIVLDHNEVLLTGLVQRLDLMNQRGRLADAWRQIKLAGDDLKSIVNLRATQIIGTRTGSGNPFDFTFDNSEARLSASLDTPLNRRLQRNTYRLALINYNVALRNLMAAEDSIKLDLREDLRQLALDRNQYTIAVASAALAYERVISTRLRLQLAVQNVAARDFLEAQQAYTTALNSIARQHVNYITDRIELFFDIEGIQIDTCGNWQGAQRDHGPEMNLDFSGRNPRPYDLLPPNVHYSPTVRQLEQIPPGEVEIR